MVGDNEGMDNIFRIPIGDRWGDGHGKYESFTVRSNKTIKEVRAIHKNHAEATGVDITKVCDRYRDSLVPEEVATRLEKLGIPLERIDEGPESSVYMDTEVMAGLWMSLLKLTDPTFEFQFVRNDMDTLDHHVGYGLFE